ncbi:MAG: hypothetical protein JNK82_37770 [Myxococcaceae bacterium]|nr:hypothetical protein [Myxococcaceae bacterium]
MGAAKKLHLVTESIDLDSPEEGLENTLEGIAEDLRQVGQVRRDVRSWALTGAAFSSVATVGAVGAMFFFFTPGAPPPAIVIQPAPVAVVVTRSEPAPAPVAVAAAPKAVKVEEAPVSESELGLRRAFSSLWAGRPRAALQEAESVLAAEPQNVDALAAHAFALFDLRRDRAAKVEVKKALKLAPKHPLANVLRGTMAQVDKDVGSALAHYDKYLRQRPRGVLADELASVRTNLSPTSTK